MKKDVRLQLFITSKMDDKLDDMVSLMGMHKNEIIRVAIANYLYTWGESVNLAKDLATRGDDAFASLFERLRNADKPF